MGGLGGLHIRKACRRQAFKQLAGKSLESKLSSCRIAYPFACRRQAFKQLAGKSLESKLSSCRIAYPFACRRAGKQKNVSRCI